jgi:hypothetical protein
MGHLIDGQSNILIQTSKLKRKEMLKVETYAQAP